MNTVTATAHHLHGPNYSRPMAGSLPGFRHSMSRCHGITIVGMVTVNLGHGQLQYDRGIQAWLDTACAAVIG